MLWFVLHNEYNYYYPVSVTSNMCLMCLQQCVSLFLMCDLNITGSISFKWFCVFPSDNIVIISSLKSGIYLNTFFENEIVALSFRNHHSFLFYFIFFCFLFFPPTLTNLSIICFTYNFLQLTNTHFKFQCLKSNIICSVQFYWCYWATFNLFSL